MAKLKLNKNSKKKWPTEYRDMSRRFRLAVGDPKSPPDLRHSYINLEVGYEYTILIEVAETQTMEGVEMLSVEDRKCM